MDDLEIQIALSLAYWDFLSAEADSSEDSALALALAVAMAALLLAFSAFFARILLARKSRRIWAAFNESAPEANTIIASIGVSANWFTIAEKFWTIIVIARIITPINTRKQSVSNVVLIFFMLYTPFVLIVERFFPQLYILYYKMVKKTNFCQISQI